MIGNYLLNYKLFELLVGLPLRNFPAFYSFYSEFIRHQLMRKFIRNWEYVSNSGNVWLYVMESEIGFTRIKDKALQSCHLFINVYLTALICTYGHLGE